MCGRTGRSLTKQPLPSQPDDLIPLQPAVLARRLIRAHRARHVEPVASVGDTQPLDLAIPVLLLPGEPLVAGGDQGPQLAALLGRLLADELVQRGDLPPGQPTRQPPCLVAEHVQLAPNDPDPSRQGGAVHKDRRQERVTEVVTDGDVGPVESTGHLHQRVLGCATGTVQGWLVPPGGGLLLRGDAQVGDGVDGDDAGGDPVADRGELADGEGQVAAGREAHDRNLRLVDVGHELVVLEDGRDLGLQVGEGAGEGAGGGLGVVEGNDQGVVLVGKDVVPGVVVGGVADDEAPAVDGEQEGQARRRRGLAVVGLGEEDSHRQAGPRRIRLDEGWVVVGWAPALPPVPDGHGRADDEQLHGVDGQRVQDPGEERLAGEGQLVMAACAGIYGVVVVVAVLLCHVDGVGHMCCDGVSTQVLIKCLRI